MNFRTSTLRLGTAALASILMVGSAVAQETQPKQDMKEAGHDSKNALSETGHGIASGTKKGYRKTKHGVRKAYHKTANTLDPHKNSQDANHQ